MMKFMRSLFRFFDSKQISAIDLAAAGLLVGWIRNSTWSQFLSLLGFMVIMGLLKTAVSLGEETAHLEFVAREIEKYAKPIEKEEEPPVE